MNLSVKGLWSTFLAFLLFFSIKGPIQAAGNEEDHSGHLSEMTLPERGVPSPVPTGTVRQAAGPEMMNRLSEKLDHEIQRAGGNLGGFTSSAQAHTAMQGTPLQMSMEETVTQGGRCPSGVPVKSFDISAINAEITLNRFLDYFPGYLYVLTEEVDKVRAEEKNNAEARKSDALFPPAAVSLGLQGDA